MPFRFSARLKGASLLLLSLLLIFPWGCARFGFEPESLGTHDAATSDAPVTDHVIPDGSALDALAADGSSDAIAADGSSDAIVGSLTGLVPSHGELVPPFSPETQSYTVAVGIWVETISFLKASNTETDDRFGGDVSLLGNTLAVGAIWEDGSSMGVGGDEADNSAADATWSQRAYLKGTPTAPGDSFGDSLCFWGESLAVGASGEGAGGAAFVIR
ncbi:MAG: hypothetical protein JRH20_28855 [Deltaproteobacteria bacterium]|nr:hypothetical protein [Deltaproteobacteria bacterium]